MYERKQRIKDLLAQGKPLPTELREEARTGAKDLVLDEAQAGASDLDLVVVECSASGVATRHMRPDGI